MAFSKLRSVQSSSPPPETRGWSHHINPVEWQLSSARSGRRRRHRRNGTCSAQARTGPVPPPAGGPPREGITAFSVNTQLLEPPGPEPRPDRVRQVRGAPMAGPDHGGASGAQVGSVHRRCVRPRRRSGSRRPRTRARHRWVPHPRRLRSSRRRPRPPRPPIAQHRPPCSCPGRRGGVELDQAGTDVVALFVPGKHLEEVPALAGTHADHPDRTGGGPIECLADPTLDVGQASADRRVRVVVGGVPGRPVPRVIFRHDRASVRCL